MKTFDICFCALITLLQLTSSLEDACGEAQIVLVSNVTKTHFPWVGVIYNVAGRATGDIKYLCGASLISETFSVTAAHCFHEKQSSYRRSPNDVNLFFGIYDLREINSTTGSAIQEINLHPDWDPHIKSFDGDLAVLKHTNTIQFSILISPVCLWPNRMSFEKGTVISWTDAEEDDPGYWNHQHDPLHNHPQRYEMPIRTNSQCLISQPRFTSIASERTFCAGGLNSGQCLEIGNSGASMSVEVDGKFYLLGIVSASFIDIDGCDNITFSLFTDVSKFKSWIIESIKES